MEVDKAIRTLREWLAEHDTAPPDSVAEVRRRLRELEKQREELTIKSKQDEHYPTTGEGQGMEG